MTLPSLVPQQFYWKYSQEREWLTSCLTKQPTWAWVMTHELGVPCPTCRQLYHWRVLCVPAFDSCGISGRGLVSFVNFQGLFVFFFYFWDYDIITSFLSPPFFCLFRFILCVWVLCPHGCVHEPAMPSEAGEVLDSLRSEILGSYRMFRTVCQCWELNLGAPQEQHVLRKECFNPEEAGLDLTWDAHRELYRCRQSSADDSV